MRRDQNINVHHIHGKKKTIKMQQNQTKINKQKKTYLIWRFGILRRYELAGQLRIGVTRNLTGLISTTLGYRVTTLLPHLQNMCTKVLISQLVDSFHSQTSPLSHPYNFQLPERPVNDHRSPDRQGRKKVLPVSRAFLTRSHTQGGTVAYITSRHEKWYGDQE